jgi:phosphoribosylanthranilate isomerase
MSGPQIKICGLTCADEALACARAGADAIGLVFYPFSPRCVSTADARRICAALPPQVRTVGVFVDARLDALMHQVDVCGLDAVQLHGQEPPELVARLKRSGRVVIKALFAARPPDFATAARYRASALLAECGRGRLPGGNAEVWDWSSAAALKTHGPLILAGGLDPANVADALKAGQPDAVDVSSGVESAPGRKDPRRVAAFIRAVRAAPAAGPLRPVFTG